MNNTVFPWSSVVAGAHHLERTSTLYPWSNLCPDWAIFRNVFPANFCLHCGPYMTELNAEKNGGQTEGSHPSSVFLNHFCPFPRRFQPYADRSGDRRSRETILKIDLVWEMDAPGDGLLVVGNEHANLQTDPNFAGVLCIIAGKK